MSICIAIDPEDYVTELDNFYRNVAKEIGHTETESTRYDCREINVANNIQEAWFTYYKEKYNAADWEIAMLLAMSGPKVDNELSDDAVEIFDGFITEERK